MNQTLDDQIGLCRDCIYHRLIVTARASQFYLCQLSERDPRFAKYPRLPVRQCIGYELHDEHTD